MDVEGTNLDLQGWVTGFHMVDPIRHDYLACMKYLQQMFYKDGVKNVGPIRAIGVKLIKGKPVPQPWIGPNARYQILATNDRAASSLMASFPETGEKTLPIFIGRSIFTSKFHCKVDVNSRAITLRTETEQQDTTHLYPVSATLSAIDPSKRLAITRKAFKMEAGEMIMKERLEEAVMRKIHHDLPYTRGDLTVVTVRVQRKTGRWDKDWIIMHFRTKMGAMKFTSMVNNTAPQQPPDPTDPHMVTVNSNGSITSYIRYDLWLPPTAPATATSTVWAIMGDIRNDEVRRNLPAPPDFRQWSLVTVVDEEEQQPIMPDTSQAIIDNIQLSGDPLPVHLDLSNPNQLIRSPGHYAKHITPAQITLVGRAINILRPHAGDKAWVVADKYG